MKLLIGSVLLAFLAINVSAKTDKIVCYFGSWSVYRHGNGKFDVENIDPTLCTHHIFTFVGLTDNGQIKVLDPYNELEENWGRGAFARFVKLKRVSPGAKMMIAIGGWNEGSERYSKVFGNDDLRTKFVANAIEFLQKHNFDGLDLDWEYPNQRGGQQADVQSFVKLTRQLKEAFAPHGFLLTAAVAAAENSVSLSYNVPEISKNLDFINVMAYDLHGSWEKFTGHNAPLYASSKDVSTDQAQLNVKACIESWINKGADPSKLVLGMGMYGRSFTLNSVSNHGIKAPADNPGNAGPYTNQAGFLGFNEVVELQNKGGWTKVWDDEQQIPYTYNGNQWIGYDDPQSIRLKAEFAVAKGLGGVMIWSIETDDFLGISGTKFALLRTMNDVIGRHVEPVTTDKPASTTTSTPRTSTPTPTTTTDHTRTTTSGDMSYLCKTVGFIRDPVRCDKFYYCVNFGDGFQAFTFYCSNGLVFDPVHDVCNYPSEVVC